MSRQRVRRPPIATDRALPSVRPTTRPGIGGDAKASATTSRPPGERTESDSIRRWRSERRPFRGHRRTHRDDSTRPREHDQGGDVGPIARWRSMTSVMTTGARPGEYDHAMTLRPSSHRERAGLGSPQLAAQLSQGRRVALKRSRSTRWPASSSLPSPPSWPPNCAKASSCTRWSRSHRPPLPSRPPSFH